MSSHTQFDDIMVLITFQCQKYVDQYTYYTHICIYVINDDRELKISIWGGYSGTDENQTFVTE
jgi:hypothetical protein